MEEKEILKSKARELGLCDKCWCYEPSQERFCLSTRLPITYCTKGRTKPERMVMISKARPKPKKRVRARHRQLSFHDLIVEEFFIDKEEEHARTI